MWFVILCKSRKFLGRIQFFLDVPPIADGLRASLLYTNSPNLVVGQNVIGNEIVGVPGFSYPLDRLTQGKVDPRNGGVCISAYPYHKLKSLKKTIFKFLFSEVVHLFVVFKFPKAQQLSSGNLVQI